MSESPVSVSLVKADSDQPDQRPLPTERAKQLLAQLYDTCAERGLRETAIERTFAQRQVAIEKEYREARSHLESRSHTQRSDIEAEYVRVQRNAQNQHEQERRQLDERHREGTRKISIQSAADEKLATKRNEEARWEAITVYDATKNAPLEKLNQMRANIVGYAQQLDQVHVDTDHALHEAGLFPSPFEIDPPETSDAASSLRELGQEVSNAQQHLWALQSLRSPGLVRGPKIILWFLLALLIAVPTAGFLFDFHGWQWIVAAVGGTVLLGSGLILIVHLYARSQVIRLYEPLAHALARADLLHDRALQQAEEECMKQSEEIRTSHLREIDEIGRRYQGRIDEITQERTAAVAKLAEEYPAQIAAARERRDAVLSEAQSKYPKLLSDLDARLVAERKAIEQRHEQQLVDNAARRDREWGELIQFWGDAMENLRAEIADISQQVRQWYPSWRSDVWNAWQPPTKTPPMIRFGEIDVKLSDIPAGIPGDRRLKDLTLPGFTLPATAPFPERGSFLFEATDSGRDAAVQSLQSIMLRLLTAIPPSKARFTIIDPVGLGENFAGFMHLADFDEALVTNRIWTEPQHIEQRLGDLTEQMENVIQKYLRNEFDSIEEYNVFAGEVAEPFRILVVANFPQNFTDTAIRRLVSIASSGARCGVHTLITVDMKQKFPMRFDIKELEAHATVLKWNGEQFEWNEPELDKYPLRLDLPAGAQESTELLRKVGQAANDAAKVEVPFEFIAPGRNEWWTGDTRRSIDAALGRVGAKKRQFMQLGKGTSQHVLVAGKTGSGKSTLWHVLITNLALLYSPDEVELYLIDFKKGVEFKTYAAHHLPHARVVAVESEREFGLSVLQRLDEELKQRGDLFRAAGVQDIAGYRDETNERMPRVLLIVDEFQEIFVEDDKIAQDASLLLDRLVRQGRAFGIHVLLGSQTLGGAYSLARSTVGQMAVRIALQCSETDAHLILSDDNTAARLLSRPGEAIYNDANGLVEGNKPFQVVWLNDDQREDYLNELPKLAAERGIGRRSQIVFEGNVPADLPENLELAKLLEAPQWPPAPRAPKAWLGDAVAIKDPTAAVFRPQAGSNLLVVGQAAEAALGMFTSITLGLAAQHTPADDSSPPGSAKFYILDGSQVDSEHVDWLSSLADYIPHPLRIARWREVPAVLAEVAAEIERRTGQGDYEAGNIYLLVYDLGRFRDLRRDENDYGFSSFGDEGDKPPSPHKLFSQILREGSGVGVHSTVWCDSSNSLNRTFDRSALREFEMRALFQMSAIDSTNLIDSPAASRLGSNRGLYAAEDLGQLEKFRPYDLPAREWLDRVRDLFDAKTSIAKPSVK